MLEPEEVCYAPVRNLQETMQDLQARSRDMFIDNPTPGKRRIKEIGIAPKLSLTPGKIRRPSPTIGQDTEEILMEIGLQSPEIFELKSEGVIR